MKVNRQHIIALRGLTGMPISECHDALVEASNDFVAVVRKLQGHPFYVSDAELSAVLAACGVEYTAELREPIILSDADVVACLTACGTSECEYFLVEGKICSINDRGELMACSIDDEDFAASATAYLRRVGAREFASFAELQKWRSNAKQGVASDGCGE